MMSSTNQNLKERYEQFSLELTKKINGINTEKQALVETHNYAKLILEEHFQNVINNMITEIKNSVQIQLENEYAHLTAKIDFALTEANNLKSKLENEAQSYESLLKLCTTANEQQGADQTTTRTSQAERIINEENLDYDDYDALMINDSVNEYSNETDTPKSKLDSCVHTIDSLMKEQLVIDNLISDMSSELLGPGVVKFVPCTPDLNGLCFGHFCKDVNKQALQQLVAMSSSTVLISSVDQLDHTKISVDIGKVTFAKNEKASIAFSWQAISVSQSDLREYLQISLIDSNANKVPYQSTELSDQSISINFTPASAGLYKLVVTFNDAHVQNSPFTFCVVDSPTTSTPPSIVAHKSLPFKPQTIKIEPDVIPIVEQASNFNPNAHASSRMGNTVADKLALSARLSTPTGGESMATKTTNNQPLDLNSSPFTSSIYAGRGRLLKLSEKKSSLSGGISHLNRLVSDATIPKPQAQKRKSPTQLQNGQHDADDDAEMNDLNESNVRDISNQLNKVVCMDENSSHELGQTSSIRNLMSLNVNTAHSNSYRQANPNQLNLVSDHLRKYSNGLVRSIDDRVMPPIKAKFQRKYPNCSFPIGVRACGLRNWLLVCDSGTHSLKIFEKTTGELLKELKSCSEYTFHRPSAVLIDPKCNSEIYVKDDKEIFVFDLENDCRLVRKIGSKILTRPYGLAFDASFNLVLVDADLKNPVVYVFDRKTGRILSSCSFQPAIKKFADSAQLVDNFGPKGRQCMGGMVQPFEKSKIRFICTNQNSLYAADLGRSVVYKTDLEGNIELAFGFYGKKKGEFNEPSGIHVDSDGNAILVGDSRNDRIQIYDSMGKYKCDIEFEEKITRPSDIHLDADGYLYVSCFLQQCVKKYKIMSD